MDIKIELWIFSLQNVVYGQKYPMLKFKVDLTVNLLQLNTQIPEDLCVIFNFT